MRAGKRYTAAVNMGWAEAKSEFTFVINTNKNTKYDIWLKEASTTSPANLTNLLGRWKYHTHCKKMPT